MLHRLRDWRAPTSTLLHRYLGTASPRHAPMHRIAPPGFEPRFLGLLHPRRGQEAAMATGIRPKPQLGTGTICVTGSTVHPLRRCPKPRMIDRPTLRGSSNIPRSLSRLSCICFSRRLF